MSYILLYNYFFLNTPFERPRRRWEDNIKMNFKEVACRGIEWLELAQERER
jgi:hypothetical protein